MLALAFLCTGFLTSVLRLELPALIALFFVCGSMSICAILGRPRTACTILGAATPLLPAFGSGTLLAAGLFYLASGGWRGLPRWTSPFLVLVAIDVAGQIALDPDPLLAYLVWEGGTGEGGLSGLLAWLGSSPPAPLVSLQLLSRLVLLAALARAFRSEESGRAFERGLVVSCGIALPVIFFQAAGALEGVLPNQTSFWSHQYRYGGTFTDPNALAIFAVLVIPLLAARSTSARGVLSRCAAGALFSGWLAAPLFSGSRTYFLGVFFYVLLLCWRRSRLALVSIVLVGSGAVASLNWAARSHPEELARALDGAPAAVGRLAGSLELSSAGEAFFSRSLFWRMGANIWLDNPLAGVGYGRFAETLPIYLTRAGIDIGGWTDNSNNFYLGVLAELGALGLAALAFSLLALRGSAGGGPERTALFCLGALLLIGPHIDFDEISVITGYLFAVSTVSATRGKAARLACATIVLVASVALTARTAVSSRGFHAWERSSSAEPFRWSGRRSHLSLACPVAGRSEVRLAALNPDIGRSPLRVTIGGPCGERVVDISRPVPVEVELACGCGGGLVAGFAIEVSRAWSPRDWSGYGDDSRILGVQVYTGGSLDLLR